MNKNFLRPSPIEVFLALEKRLHVYFYTSNVPKFLHARFVFEQYGINLNHYKSHKEPYTEDYSLGKKKLLEEALKEILITVGRSTLVFVEDTSLRIEALSNKALDYPGLKVKEWFNETTFEQLDSLLKKKGRGRNAVVKSEIALHIPHLGNPKLFHGETSGFVAEKSPDFEENPQFPWLTPRSFNGWFIPEKSNRTLGNMSFEESFQYDFRIKAFVKMIKILEEYAAILNLPSIAYSKAPKSKGISHGRGLFPSEEKIFIVVGLPCAGKTTLGIRLNTKSNYRFIEASNILRSLKIDNQKEDVSDFEYAWKLLTELGADIVARNILRLYESELDIPLVITGFRTLEEIDTLKRAVPHAKIILIEASERTRFERHIRRSRIGGVNTSEDFREVDQQQKMFGLLEVAEDLADIRIENEGTLKEYFNQIDVLNSGDSLNETTGISKNRGPRHGFNVNRINRCLQILKQANRSLDCKEIEIETSKTGVKILHNNVNKVLKVIPGLVKRYELEGTKVKYSILESGRTYLRLMAQIYQSKM